MAKRRPWLNDALRLLDERAYTSPELSEILMRKHRNGPCAKQVTLVLKRDPRFQLLGDSTTSSLMRSSSHVVPIFGRSDRNYETKQPWRRL